MSAFIPMSISGSTLSGEGLNIKDVLTITENKYVNESGDKCESLQVNKYPKDDKDVVNKKALEDRVIAVVLFLLFIKFTFYSFLRIRNHLKPLELY